MTQCDNDLYTSGAHRADCKWCRSVRLGGTVTQRKNSRPICLWSPKIMSHVQPIITFKIYQSRFVCALRN